VIKTYKLAEQMESDTHNPTREEYVNRGLREKLEA